MQIEIEWRAVGRRSKYLEWTRCLYGYVDLGATEIVYIGKADGKTVRERFDAPDKDALFDFLENDHKIADIGICVGDILVKSDIRLTRQLLSDIESLLIKRVQPIGNIMARRSRISRPGMEVICFGGWPFSRSRFRDVR